MSLKEGLLSGLAGFAGAGARAAETEFQNEITLQRQLSLMDTQRRYRKEDALVQGQSFLDITSANPDLFPGLVFDDAEEATAFLQSGLAGTAIEGMRSKEAKAQEAARYARVWENTPELRERFDSPSELVDAISTGAFSMESLNEEDDLPDEQARALSELLGISEDAVRGAAGTNSLSTISEQVFRGRREGSDGPSFKWMVNTKEGTVLQVPIESTTQMLAARDSEGKQIWQIGETDEIEGESYVVAGSTRVRVPTIGEEGPAALDPNSRSGRLQESLEFYRNNTGFKDSNLDYVNPTSLTGVDMIDESVGMWDSAQVALTRFGPTRNTLVEVMDAVSNGSFSQSGREGIEARNILAQNFLDARKLFGADSNRPLSAIIEHLMRVVPNNLNGLKGMFSSEDAVRTNLTSYMNAVRQARDHYDMVSRTGRDANGTSFSSDDREEAASLKVLGEKILGDVQSILVNSEISNLNVRVRTNRGGRANLLGTVPLTEITLEDVRDIDTRGLTDRQKQLVTLWIDRLQLAEMRD